MFVVSHCTLVRCLSLLHVLTLFLSNAYTHNRFPTFSCAFPSPSCSSLSLLLSSSHSVDFVPPRALALSLSRARSLSPFVSPVLTFLSLLFSLFLCLVFPLIVFSLFRSIVFSLSSTYMCLSNVYAYG